MLVLSRSNRSTEGYPKGVAFAYPVIGTEEE